MVTLFDQVNPMVKQLTDGLFELRGRSRFPAALLLAFILGAANHAEATPEKAAKFYEDALQKFEKNDLAGAVIQIKNAIQQDNRMLQAHLLLGKALLKLGQLKAAEAALEEAVKQGVDRSEVVLALGQVYLSLGEPKFVIDRIQATGLPVSLQAEVLALRGTAYAESGNTAAAMKTLEDARKLDPKSAAPLIAEIPLLLKGAQSERARAVADKVIELAPNNALAWSMHASVLHSGADFKGALAAYDRALSIDPRFAEARVARASLLMGLKRPQDAEQDLVFLKKESLDDPRAAYLRALLAGQKGDVPATKAALADAIKLIDLLPPNWVTGREHLLMAGALSHHALRNWAKAREYLDIIIARSARNLVARKLLASVYLETRDYERAQALLEALQKAEPQDAQVQFMLGTVYLAQRRYQQATDLIEKAAARTGDPAMVRDLGLSQLALGRDSVGIASLEKAFAANPSDSRTGIELATVYARRGQAQKAVQVSEAILKRDPENLAMLNFLGVIKAQTSDLPGARGVFAKLVAKDPAFRPAVLNLVRLDADESRFDDARAGLGRLLAKDGGDADALYELGVLELKAKRPAEAIRSFQKADESQRIDSKPGLALVDVLLGTGQTDQAMTAAKQLSSRYPASLLAQLALGRAYLAAGDPGKARVVFQDATRLANNDPAALVPIGRLQLSAGDPAGASSSAQKALQDQPDHALALVLQIEADTVRGERATADAALKVLVEKHPNSIAALLTGANLAMARGQYANAISGYRALLAREPTIAIAINVVQAHVAAGEPAKALAFLEGWIKTHTTDRIALKALAEIQSAVGKPEAARKTYYEVLTAEPNDAMTLNNLAVVLQKLNDPAAASVAEKALKALPGSAEIADTLGWILVQQGKLEAGLSYLRDARLRSPGNAEIRFHLAYALAKSGRKVEARGELSAALAAIGRAQLPEEYARLKTELGL